MRVLLSSSSRPRFSPSNRTKNIAVSSRRWQNWAWSNPVAWLCCLKILLFYGERILHSELQLNPIQHPSLQTWQPQLCYRARAGQRQHCWHLYLVGPERDWRTFFFCVLQSALGGNTLRGVPSGWRKQSQPWNVMVGREIHLVQRPRFVGQMKVQWLSHGISHGIDPSSSWQIVGQEIPWLKRSGTLTHCILCREVSKDAWRPTGTTSNQCIGVQSAYR